MNAWAKPTLFALDTETTSQDPMRADLVGFSFALEPDEAFYIPCGHRYWAPRAASPHGSSANR